MSRIVLTLTLILTPVVSALLFSSVQTTEPLFVAASPVAVGPGPGDVTLADLNRDGHLDIVTQHLLGRFVNVQLGDGRGAFVSSQDAPLQLAYEPAAIALGDLNLDGVPDVAIAGRYTQGEHIQTFLGTGSGGFRQLSAQAYRTGPAAEFYKPFVRIADLNEDGKADIVASNGRRNTIEVLIGDGRGGVLAMSSVKLEAGHEFYSFALGDVDGDRHLDLVTAQAGGRPDHIEIRHGDGRGKFRVWARGLRTTEDPRIEALADVDGDTDLDMVLSHAEHDHLSVFLNSGQSVFTASVGSPYRIAAEAFAVAVTDIDRDGQSDILAATMNSVTVLRGHRGTFVPASGSPFATSPGSYRIGVGDIDENGALDAAVSSFDGDSVTLLLGRAR